MARDFPVPNPIPIITAPIRGLVGAGKKVASALNPFEYVADGLGAILQLFLTLLQRVLEVPVVPNTGRFLNVLYGESLGLTSLYPYIVAILVIAAYIPRFRANLFQALVAAAFIGVATGVGFGFWNYLIYLRETWIDDIIRAKIFSSATIDFHGFDAGASTLLTIIVMPIVLYYLLKLLLLLYIEAFGIIAVKLLTPVALLLWPLGKRGKRFVSWVLATGLVSCLIGPLGATVILEIAKLTINSTHGSFLIPPLVLLVALRIAANFQVTAWEALKSATMVIVSGALSGRSLVGGKVSAKVEQQVDVNVRRNSANSHANTMPVPVVVVGNGEGQPKSRTKRGVEILTREGIALAAGGLAGAAVESGHQVAPFVASAAKEVQSHQKNKRGKSGGGQHG